MRVPIAPDKSRRSHSVQLKNSNFQYFFARDASEVAPELIGCELFVDGVGGAIVETEAYNRLDPASHSFKGQTQRNRSMFGPPGRAYVYRIYGLHWCLNFVCLDGSAVLLRALAPSKGVEDMQRRRQTNNVFALCSGPAKLAQALEVTGKLDSASLFEPPFVLRGSGSVQSIDTGPRIGISRAQDVPWRFWLAGSPYISRPSSRVGSRP